MHKRLEQRTLGLCVRAVLLASAPLLAMQTVLAATITVTSATDAAIPNTADGLCTLREAILAAQTNAVVDSCAAGSSGATDFIDFAPSLADSSISVASELDFGGGSGAGFVSVYGDINHDGRSDIRLSGGNATRVLHVYASADVTLDHLTITAGNASGTLGNHGHGGGIYNAGSLTLVGATVSGNTAQVDGGGIYNAGFVTLQDSVLSHNSAGQYGGGMINNSAAIILASTVASNRSGQDSGAIDNNGGLTIVNSTLTGNVAARTAGAISAADGELWITQSTISGNTASVGGGIYVSPQSDVTVTLTNSIVAKNQPGNCAIAPGAAISANSSGNLFFPAAQACVGGAIGDPKLQPLRDNGGPTKTMLPDVGSSAIDVVACATGMSTDQRGVARPQHLFPILGPWCDIGAVEVTRIDQDRIFRDGFD